MRPLLEREWRWARAGVPVVGDPFENEGTLKTWRWPRVTFPNVGLPVVRPLMVKAADPATPKLGVPMDGLAVAKLATLSACLCPKVGGPKVGLEELKLAAERA